MSSLAREAKPALSAPEKSIIDLFRLDGRTILGRFQRAGNRKAADDQESLAEVVLLAWKLRDPSSRPGAMSSVWIAQIMLLLSLGVSHDTGFSLH